MPTLRFTVEAAAQLRELEERPDLAKRLKAVRAALGKMQMDIRHPGLHTHVFKGRPCPHGDKLFEAYAENHTPGAYRIFWCYEPPPPPDVLRIVAITPHP